jgi:Zn-dependent protease
MRTEKREYSKIVTTTVLAIFSTLAIAFIVFVCYEMHRLGDLSPVGYIGPSIAGILVGVIGFYMSRAKAKSQTDLEWEKTKRLTLFREKHPDAFIEGVVNNIDEGADEGVG